MQKPVLTVTGNHHEICHRQIPQPYALIALLRINQELHDEKPAHHWIHKTPLETNPCISFLIASISTLQTNAVQFLRIPPIVSADLPDRLFSVWPDQ